MAMASCGQIVLSEIPDAREWAKFFEDAGIPPPTSGEYAIKFSRNRITCGHLSDLTENYLEKMGIQKIGDIIDILRHSKNIFGQLPSKTKENPVVVKKTEDRGVTVKSKSCGPTVSSARITSRESSPDSEDEFEEITPPIRVPERKSKSLKRKLSKQDETIGSEVRVTIPTSVSSTISAATRVLKKARRVVPLETENDYIDLPVKSSAIARKGETAVAVKKKSVYARLGEKEGLPPSQVVTEPSITITDNFGLVTKTPRTNKPVETVFARLGNKSNPTRKSVSSIDKSLASRVEDDDSDEVDNVNDSIYEEFVGIEEEEVDEEEEDEEMEESEPEEAEDEARVRMELKRQQMYRNQQMLSRPSLQPKSKPSLQYMGILKTSKPKSLQHKQKKLSTMRADEEQQTIRLKKVTSKKTPKPLMKKLVPKPRSNVPTTPSSAGLFANPVRNPKHNVKERLGRTKISLNKIRPINSSSSCKPTQDMSVGSTTTMRSQLMTPKKQPRQRIVYDLPEEDDNEDQQRIFMNSFNSSSMKKVTFNRKPEINYYMDRAQNNQNQERMPQGSIALRTGVFERLGN